MRQARVTKGFIQADWILRDCTPEARRFTDQELVDRLKKYTPAQRREMLKLMENMEEILGYIDEPGNNCI